MDRASSREEIEAQVRNIEKELEELRQADDGMIDFAQISQLEDEKEELENALEEMTVEMAQNSGTDFEQAKENEMEQNEQVEAEQEEIPKKQEKKIEEEKQEEQKRDEEEEKEGLGQDNSELEDKKPFDDWERQSGIIIIPCDGSRNALSNKEMTREEFIAQLSDSVTMIKSPGMAEEFFKYKPEEWEKLRNTKEEVQKAMIKYENDLPVDIDTTQVYVLYQNDEDTMHQAENEVQEVEEEPDSPKQKDIDIIKKHLTLEVAGSGVSVMTAKEALELAEKGILKEEEISSIAEEIEKKEEEVVEEAEEATVEIEENDSAGEELVKNVLASSIDNGEMVDKTMKKEDIASVSLQLKNALEKGIETDDLEKEEEEPLPGFARKIY